MDMPGYLVDNETRGIEEAFQENDKKGQKEDALFSRALDCRVVFVRGQIQSWYTCKYPAGSRYLGHYKGPVYP